MTIEYHLNITPQGAVRSNGKYSMYHATKGKRVRKYVRYKKDLALIMRSQGIEGLPDEIESMTFYLPIPNPQVGSKKIIKEKLSRIGNPHRQKPDIDNLIKPILDASGKDDSHIWRCGEVKKLWADYGKGKIIIILKKKYVLSLQE